MPREAAHGLSGAASFGDVLALRAEQAPARLAFRFLDGAGDETATLTFGQLYERALGVAGFLAAEVPAGARVVLLYPPGPDYVVSVFGCLLAGVAAVPAYPPLDAKQLRQLDAMAADAEPAAVLALPGLREYVASLAGAESKIAQVRWLAAPDGTGGAARRSDGPAILQYTSGSTRQPRGVMVTHANLLRNSAQIADCFGHTEDSRGVIWLPPYHDMGLVGGILQPVYAGFEVTLLSPLDFLHRPANWLTAVSRFGGTTSGGPNFAFDLCVRRIPEADRAGLDLSTWNVAFTGAETVRADTLRRFTDAFAPYGFAPEAFLPCYGLAEATLLVAGWDRELRPRVSRYHADALEAGRPAPVTGPDDRIRELVSVGQPAAGQVVQVVDPDTGAALPDEHVGEIWVAGANVAAGYWNNTAWSDDADSRATFTAHLPDDPNGPYLRTGDLGFRDGDGHLYLVGRRKDVLVVRGRNHAPDDIESTAAVAHPLLRVGCGACFMSGDDEQVVLVQEVRRDVTAAEADDIHARIRDAVVAAHHITVDRIVLAAKGAVPKTSSGKVRRSLCRDQLLAGELPVLAPQQAAAPQSGAAGDTQPVRRILETVLGRALGDVPGDTRLSTLGLDSLRAAELRARLADELAVSVPIHTLLTAATVDSLSTPPAGQPPRDAVPDLPEQPGELTRGEASLWFLDEFAGGDHAPTVVAHAVAVDGPLDVAAVRETVDLLAARHAALRTRVHAEAGPATRVVGDPSVAFEVVDGSGWTPEQLAAECRRRVTPVRLAGPVWHFHLLRLADDRHVLLVRTHHLVVDLWSLEVLLTDFIALYPEVAAGRTPAGADADPDPMGRLARAERQLLKQPRAERMWEYWRQELHDAPGALALPTDRERPERPSHRGAVVTGELDGATVARLRETAREADVTLPSLLLAAYGWLLHRYSGQSDVVVGSVYANRGHPDRHHVVGYLANMLPVRLRHMPDETFRSYALRTHQTSCAAMDHGELPFPVLVERLRPGREAARAPIFQAIYAFQHATRGGAATLAADDQELAVGPLRLRQWPLPDRPALADLALEASESGGAVRLRLTYAVDLFTPDTAAGLLDALRHLVAEVGRDPGQTLAAGTRPAAAVAERLLVEWNGPARDYPAGELLHEPFQRWAETQPDAEAVVDGARTVTYRWLDERSSRLARRLRAAGLGPEDRVGVCVARSVEYVIALLGVLKAGAAYLPLDPDLPPDRLRHLCEQSGARLVLAAGGPARDVAAKITGPGRGLLDLTEAVRDDGAATAAVDCPADARNLGYVMYTSGSTGEPKAVGVPHRAVANLLADFRERGTVAAGSRCAWWTNTGFDVSVYEIFSAFHVGGCVAVVPEAARIDGGDLARWMRDQRIASAFVPPFAMLDFVADLERHGPPPLRRLLTGVEPIAEPLARRLVAALPDTAVVNAYGPTEATVMCTAYLVAAGALGERRLPIGRALRNLGVYVLDPDGRLLPPGVVGELCVGGAQLARGYLGRPAATAERFVPDPYAATAGARMYRTGDLVRYRHDGQLEFVGRADHQVKLNGQRVELGEIQAVLARHPAVREAVAVVTGDGPRRHVVAYAIGPQTSDTAPDEQAREVLLAAARLLPRHMMPARLHWLAAWPLSANGKVDRGRLPAVTTPAAPSQPRVPATPQARLIAEVLAAELGVAEIAADENFFALGGHSLAAARAVIRLRRLLHVDLPVSAIFQSPTPIELGYHLAAGSPVPRAGGLRRQPRGAASVAAFTADRARLSTMELPAGLSVAELIAGVLAAELGIAEVAPDENFFALGGHSLAAARAVIRLRRLLQADLPMSVIFQYPTPAALGRHLETTGTARRTGGIRRQPRGAASVAALTAAGHGATPSRPPGATR